jgi:hypothetical protein
MGGPGVSPARIGFDFNPKKKLKDQPVNFDDAVVLETFSSRIEAEMAQGILESEGIEVVVMADDAGGAYPMLQFVRGVRLLVAAEDEARAKEILAAMADGGDLIVEP